MHVKISDDHPNRLPGRYVVKALDSGEFYWHAYLDDKRVNGGLAVTYVEAVRAAKAAIQSARFSLLIEDYYWDIETHGWVRKGELPPL